MATYTPRQNPDQPVLITSVGVGDQINFRDVLGRAADRVQIYATSATDTVEYMVNNLQITRGSGSTYGGSSSYVARAYDVSKIKHCWRDTDVFTNVGQEFELGSDLTVFSLEITALTLGTGSTVEIIAW